jgi:hypothetical protein
VQDTVIRGSRDAAVPAPANGRVDDIFVRRQGELPGIEEGALCPDSFCRRRDHEATRVEVMPGEHRDRCRDAFDILAFTGKGSGHGASIYSAQQLEGVRGAKARP